MDENERLRTLKFKNGPDFMVSRQEWLERPEGYIGRLHSQVQADYEARKALNPGLCNYPYGLVSPQAKRPNPQWCSLPLGHQNSHSNESQAKRRRTQVRNAVSKFRSKGE